jgi:hypothetical protein
MIALLDVIDDGQPAPPATGDENQDPAAAGGGALTEEPPRVSGEAYKGAASWFAYHDALIAEHESA